MKLGSYICKIVPVLQKSSCGCKECTCLFWSRSTQNICSIAKATLSYRYWQVCVSHARDVLYTVFRYGHTSRCITSATTPSSDLYLHCLIAGMISMYLEVDVGRAAIESARKNSVKCSHAGTAGESHTPQEGQVVCFTCMVGGGCSTACK